MKSPSDDEIAKLAADKNETIRALAAEITRLRAGIRDHQRATGHELSTGHELCWLNDVALWKLLDSEAAYPHDTLPVAEEFLSQCHRYHESRVKNTPYEEPAARKTVAKNA